MALTDMTTGDFLAAALTVRQQMPGAVLRRNEVGNLALYEGEAYVGWVDLHTGEVHVFADEDSAG